MSRKQTYRGDPEQKILYLSDDFSGGVNVVDVDGVIKDNEFRKLVNVELEKKGLLPNRKGFKFLNMFDELLQECLLEADYEAFPQATHLFKIVKDDGNLLDKFIEYSHVEENVVEVGEEEYVYTPTNNTLTILDFYNATNPYIYDFRALIVNDFGVYDLIITKGIDQFFDVEYNLLYEFSKNNGELSEFTLTTLESNTISLSNFLGYDFIKLEIDDYPSSSVPIYFRVYSDVEDYVNDVDDVYIYVNVVDGVSYLKFDNESASTLSIKLQGTNIKKVKGNIKTIDYNDKIYFSLSDVLDSEYGLGVYDVINGTFDTIDNENYYEPTPFEIRLDSALDFGFNMLAESPLTAIEEVETTVKTVRNIYLTEIGFDDRILYKIPTSGDFVLNVLKTGTTLSPYELKITLKNQAEEELEYIYSGVLDNGTVFQYTFEGINITNFAKATMLYIDVEKNEDILETSSLSVPFYPYSKTNYGYVVREKTTRDYYMRISETGYDENSYVKISIFKSVYDASPSTADPTVVLSAYMISENNLKRFEIYNDELEQYFVYMYAHATSSFSKNFDSTSSSEISVDELSDVFPKLKQTIIKALDTGYYYVRTSSINESIADFTQLENYSENEGIEPLLGQQYEIGSSQYQKIEGVDLTNVKIIEINGRLLYYSGNTIWYSLTNRFDYLPAPNYIILPLSIDDEIVSINFFRGSYIVFTKNKIFKLAGTFFSDLKIVLVSDFVGCIARNSIRAIENSLYFLSKQGLYRLVLNYYTESLENVQKVDDKIRGEIEIKNYVDSILYNGQYWLLFQDGDVYDTVKYYYNIDLPNSRHPFVFDIYANKPDLLFNYNLYLIGIKDGKMFVYDDGYTDFYYDENEDINDYIPIGEIETSDLTFDAPTHDKKIKSIYFKTYCDKVVPLAIKVYLDGYEVIDPTSYVVSVDENTGEVLYTVTDNDNLEIKKTLLGNFEIGTDKLGDSNQTVHKMVVSRKGKAIRINIKFKTYNYFGIANIGILYKLGKVKENR